MDERAALEQTKRIVGIDYGSRRVGISLSDPLGIIAQPKGTLINNDGLFDDLREIIESNGVSLVIVGMPLNLKGQKGKKAEEVGEFITRLKQETGVDVVEWDERFTTSIARQTLIDLGTKKKDRRDGKHQVDSMAAAVILQSFLDSTKRSLSC